MAITPCACYGIFQLTTRPREPIYAHTQEGVIPRKEYPDRLVTNEGKYRLYVCTCMYVCVYV